MGSEVSSFPSDWQESRACSHGLQEGAPSLRRPENPTQGFHSSLSPLTQLPLGSSAPQLPLRPWQSHWEASMDPSFVFWFGAMSGGVQGLFLALCSGIARLPVGKCPDPLLFLSSPPPGLSQMVSNALTAGTPGPAEEGTEVEAGGPEWKQLDPAPSCSLTLVSQSVRDWVGMCEVPGGLFKAWPTPAVRTGEAGSQPPSAHPRPVFVSSCHENLGCRAWPSQQGLPWPPAFPVPGGSGGWAPLPSC